MSNEIHVLKSKLADKQERLRELTLKADNFIITIREQLDVYEEDFTELPVDRTFQAMKDFREVWKEAKVLKEQIARMRKDLGYE